MSVTRMTLFDQTEKLGNMASEKLTAVATARRDWIQSTEFALSQSLSSPIRSISGWKLKYPNGNRRASRGLKGGGRAGG